MAKRRLRASGRNETEIRRAIQHADLYNLTLVLSDQDIADLASIATLVAGDLVVVVHDPGTGMELSTITFPNFVGEVEDELIDGPLDRWEIIATSRYTVTPASTSRLTMSDTTGITVGSPIKYTIGGTTYYGLVTAVSADSYIDVAGAPLGGDVTALALGNPEKVVQYDFFVSSTYGDGADDLLDADMNTAFRWGLGAAYLVAFAGIHKTDDTGADQPKINVKVAGSAVSTNDSNNGIELSTSWVENSAVAINASNYGITRGDAVEVACTVAGSNSDAEDLTVTAVFILA